MVAVQAAQIPDAAVTMDTEAHSASRDHDYTNYVYNHLTCKDDDRASQGNLDEDLPVAMARPVHSRRIRASIGSREQLLLHRMKQRRKIATVNSGLWGGVLGLILLGPIGAVGLGYGSAMAPKHSMKRREKFIRRRLEGQV